MRLTKAILATAMDLAMGCAAEKIDRVFISVKGDEHGPREFEVVSIVPKLESVIVQGCYMDEGVGRVIPDTYDEQGGCLLWVRLEDITSVMTPDEYQQYCDCREADERLLSYAR